MSADQMKVAEAIKLNPPVSVLDAPKPVAVAPAPAVPPEAAAPVAAAPAQAASAAK
jgi:hypothetical protein